jgi:hypothetical protein
MAPLNHLFSGAHFEPSSRDLDPVIFRGSVLASIAGSVAGHDAIQALPIG